MKYQIGQIVKGHINDEYFTTFEGEIVKIQKENGVGLLYGIMIIESTGNMQLHAEQPIEKYPVFINDFEIDEIIKDGKADFKKQTQRNK